MLKEDFMENESNTIMNVMKTEFLKSFYTLNQHSPAFQEEAASDVRGNSAVNL